MHSTRPPVKGGARKNSPRARRRWENAADAIISPERPAAALGRDLQRPQDAAEVRRVVTFPRGAR